MKEVDRTDYFIIVYCIIKHLYGCLKTGRYPIGKLPGMLDSGFFPVSRLYWLDIWQHLVQERLVEGVVCDKEYDVLIITDKARPSIKGIEYLAENDHMLWAAQEVKGALEFNFD